MSYIFLGTPEFAQIILRHLIDAGHVPTAVICNPDRPVGRKKIITPPPVKQYIQGLSSELQNQITILQPGKLSDIEESLRALSPDLFVVAAYGKIISQTVLEIPRHGTVGVHPSLLPLLRGSSPIQTALLDGVKETGVSLFFVDKDVDHGPVIKEETLNGIDLNICSYLELHNALAELGGAMIATLFPELAQGTAQGVEQNHEAATFTKKFTSENGFVDHNDLQLAMQGEKERTIKIDRMIRALNPEPGVYTIAAGKRMKLLKAKITEGGLKLQRIQMEGGVPQDLTY